MCVGFLLCGCGVFFLGFLSLGLVDNFLCFGLEGLLLFFIYLLLCELVIYVVFLGSYVCELVVVGCFYELVECFLFSVFVVVGFSVVFLGIFVLLVFVLCSYGLIVCKFVKVVLVVGSLVWLFLVWSCEFDMEMLILMLLFGMVGLD